MKKLIEIFWGARSREGEWEKIWNRSKLREGFEENT
jgi:hypothetical protein